MMWHQIAVLLLALWSDSASGLCPSGCICANTVVECKCAHSSSGSMTLGSFRHIEFVSKLYIHSCHNLTIPAEAFSGLAISNELSISAIHFLQIHPFAFRDLIKYPEKFTIAGCNIPLLPTNTFVGFHRTAHMWFRNVTVSRIAEGAFRHVSDVEYVYFRESNLGRVESHAFSNMTNISHLFIRGATRIDRIEASAFQHSVFRKVIFEDVKLRSLNAHVFNGPLRYDSVLFDNVTVENVDTVHGNAKLEGISSARRLEFLRCRFERRLPLAAFGSNVLDVKLEDVHIDRLAPISTSTLHNITRIRFIRSTINTLESRAMYDASNVRAVTFEDSVINGLGEKAFGAVTGLEDLNFFRSMIQYFPTSTFENAVMKRIIVSRCRIEMVHSGAFGNAHIGHLRFAFSEIKTIEPEAFIHLDSNYMGFEYTRINEMKAHAFGGLRVNTLNISNCDLRPRVNETWLTAASFRNLIMNTNKLPCSCTSKLSAQMASIREQKELMSSSFTSLNNNFCVDEVTNDTLMLEDYYPSFCRKANLVREYVDTGTGLQCTRSLFLVSCVCTGSSNDHNAILDEPTTKKLPMLRNATTLVVAHCRRLRAVRNALLHFSLSHLVFSHCDSLELETDFWWQKTAPTVSMIRISHVGRLRLHRNAFSFSQSPTESGIVAFPDLEFVNCTIGKISTDVFENARIGRLGFISSRIGVFESLFARKSRIDDFSVQNSEVGRFSTWAFNDTVIDKIRLERSRIHEMQQRFISDRLTKRVFVCFVENQLDCHCDLRGMDALSNANGCDGGSNTCFEYEGAAKIADGAKEESKMFHCHDNALGGVYDFPQRDMAELVRSVAIVRPVGVWWWPVCTFGTLLIHWIML